MPWPCCNTCWAAASGCLQWPWAQAAPTSCRLATSCLAMLYVEDPAAGAPSGPAIDLMPNRSQKVEAVLEASIFLIPQDSSVCL
jgi:hypothetical protein